MLKTLTDPGRDPIPAAQALYSRLFAPVAPILEEAGIQSLMVGLDGALRYLPLAALHDGERWLVERYALSLYTAASVKNLLNPPRSDWYAAGLGVSRAHSLERGGVRSDFSALNAVPGEFDGETAMGAANAKGREIEGLGSVVQSRGAKGVLASLWKVADASTGELMQNVYRLRGNNTGLTKADALRLAQLDLMGSPAFQSEAKERGLTLDDEAVNETANRGATRDYSHPYYWAPFILMGNWL